MDESLEEAALLAVVPLALLIAARPAPAPRRMYGSDPFSYDFGAELAAARERAARRAAGEKSPVRRPPGGHHSRSAATELPA